MSPRRCYIAGCSSANNSQLHRGVTFHAVPADLVTRSQWITNCRLPDTTTITKTLLICSRHFRRADFQPLRNNKYQLIPGSVPTIFPWTQAPAAAAGAAAAVVALPPPPAPREAAKEASAKPTRAAAAASASKSGGSGARSSTDRTQEERIVNQILSDAIRAGGGKSPMKRSASADVGASTTGAEPKTKQMRKSLDSAMFKRAAAAAAAANEADGAAGSADPAAAFPVGSQIEAQDFQEVWHAAEVVEVDCVDREVLVHFDTTNAKIIDEWIPMDSSRLRPANSQPATEGGAADKAAFEEPSGSSLRSTRNAARSVETQQPPETVVAPPAPSSSSSSLIPVSPVKSPAASTAASSSAVPIPTSPASMQPATPLPGNLPVLKKAPYNYVAGEKCMAKWTDSRRWRATVQTVLDLDYYDVLFDDGYSKRCHAKDMSKIKRQPPLSGSTAPPPFSAAQLLPQQPLPPPAPAPVVFQPAHVASSSSTAAAAATSRPTTGGGRKINPPLPIPKFDLSTLNLLPVPKDGEWCCNWVNDTPIGKEGYLEGPDGNRRPTVLVDDWRLPSGWTKHLYQRSSVSGKWDVVLVGPTKKRFRSKNDVKVFLDEHGLQYNPDVYDFSIHKRRAKDLGLFVFTEEYREAQQAKQQQLLQKLAAEQQRHTVSAPSPLADAFNASNISNFSSDEMFPGFPAMPSTPIGSPAHASLMLSTAGDSQSAFAAAGGAASAAGATATVGQSTSPLAEGYVFVGSLKVRFNDSVYSCPSPGCPKVFRKENHLQIHVKHYHQQLAGQVGDFPNMAELAYIRTTGELPAADDSSQSQSAYVQEASAAAAHEVSLADEPIDGGFQANVSGAGGSGAGGLTASTPIKYAQSHEAGQSTAAAAATGSAYAKKYKKSASKLSKSRQKSKGGSHRAGQSLNGSGSGRRKGAATHYDEYYEAANDEYGEYADSDYVPEGHGAERTAQPTVRSNRLKFLSHPQVAVAAAANGEPPDGSGGAGGSQPSAMQMSLVATDVYVDENGEVIKLVRMRQEEIINCVCLYAEEDGLMIQCELCLTWQHGRCQGYDKEAEVPQKYVCYICQNPQSGRDSMRFVHDQEWLYEGRLPVTAISSEQQRQRQSEQEAADVGGSWDDGSPVAGSEAAPVLLAKHRARFETLKHNHTLTGNLLELKRFMHSLQVKINIAENKDHPKMYLWAHKWEKSSPRLASATATAAAAAAGGGGNNSSSANSAAAEVPSGIVPLGGDRQTAQCNGSAEDSKTGVVKLEQLSADSLVVLDTSPPTHEEVLVINDLMANDSADAMKHIERAAAEIAKTEVKSEAADPKNEEAVKQEDEVDGNILAGLLTSPGGTNIDLVGAVAAVAKQETVANQQQRQPTTQSAVGRRSQQQQLQQRTPPARATVPQPEVAIDPVECQQRLLEHIQKQQILAMTRLQSIEAEICELEALDEHAEQVNETDNFGATKRQLFQLISDLTKVRKLAAINLAEDALLNPQQVAPPPAATAPVVAAHPQSTVG